MFQNFAGNTVGASMLNAPNYDPSPKETTSKIDGLFVQCSKVAG